MERIYTTEAPIMRPDEREYLIVNEEDWAGFRMYMIERGFGYAGPYSSDLGLTVIFY